MVLKILETVIAGIDPRKQIMLWFCVLVVTLMLVDRLGYLTYQNVILLLTVDYGIIQAYASTGSYINKYAIIVKIVNIRFAIEIVQCMPFLIIYIGIFTKGTRKIIF